MAAKKRTTKKKTSGVKFKIPKLDQRQKIILLGLIILVGAIYYIDGEYADYLNNPEVTIVDPARPLFKAHYDLSGDDGNFFRDVLDWERPEVIIEHTDANLQDEELRPKWRSRSRWSCRAAKTAYCIRFAYRCHKYKKPKGC